MPSLSVIRADITTLDVDAIVNAANSALLGGGGVDGAIHRAAGPKLLDACRAIPQSAPRVRCPPGEARITAGFDLPARHIIHTVGPIWSGGHDHEDDMLASCYRTCLALAHQHALESIAFPAISTGVYGFPPDRAAEIAVSTVRAALPALPTIHRIIFCCFDAQTSALYGHLLAPG